MKRSPFLSEVKLSGQFNWRRHDLVLSVGGNYYVRPVSILMVHGHSILSVARDETGLQAVSLHIRDRAGGRILAMESNDWIIEGDLDDLECPPSANRLTLESEQYGVSLRLAFKLISANDLEQEFDSKLKAGRDALLRERPDLAPFLNRVGEDKSGWELLFRSIPEWPVTLCSIEGQLQWPLPIVLSPEQTVLPGGSTVSGSVIVNCAVAILID